MILKIVTVIYLCLLLVIIFLANTGQLASYVSAYREIPFGDNLGHFILMGMLSFLVNCALKARPTQFLGCRIQLGSLLVLIFVLLEECSQLFLVRRSFSLSDIAADVAGIFCFGWVARKICQRRGGENPES